MNTDPYREAITDRQRFSKFLGVGLAGMMIDNAVLAGLSAAGGGLLIAKLISSETAITVMFLVNERWTFRDAGTGPIWKRFIKSNAVRAGGVLIAYIVLKALVTVDIPLIIANTIGICCGFGFNYTVETLYTWAAHQ